MDEKKAAEYMSIAELKEKLGICRARAYALTRENGFPAVRISPRRIVVPRDAFDAWMLARSEQNNKV